MVARTKMHKIKDIFTLISIFLLGIGLLGGVLGLRYAILLNARHHLLCEVLKPGMSKDEVLNTLKQAGEFTVIGAESPGPVIELHIAFTEPIGKDMYGAFDLGFSDYKYVSAYIRGFEYSDVICDFYQPAQLVTEIPKPTLIVRLPTKTRYPTLSPEEARRLIDDAQKTNLGCELPCWWGITPGKTSWEDAQAFFHLLNAKIEYWPPHYSITVFYPSSQKTALWLEIFPGENGLVESIRTESSYTMAEVLEKFGQPAQIWFYSDGVMPYSMPPNASLALLYPKQGMLFYDLNKEGEYFDNGNALRVCAKHLAVHSFPGFYLWNGNTQKTLEQIKGYLFDDTESWRFRPLEEVTNIDIPAFTDAFSSPDSTACFLSPIDIWPYPLP